MHQPVTTNPLIIMLINMSIVFAVLIGLSIMIRLIHLVDPTKVKEEQPSVSMPRPAAAPAAVSVAAGANSDVNIAVIAAAVAAYEGDVRIVTIRPMESAVWKNAGRVTGVSNTVC